jgi:hypothetical protein
MSNERRYSEEEVTEIFDRSTQVTTGSSTGSSLGAGMTLHELQQIGDEVGIPREVIAHAAASLDRAPPDASARRTFMGKTIGVGRSVDLPRALTEEEWNQLVVDLRMTFDAKGKIRQEGAFRQWTNGNLQALLEPSGTGQRLRLRTLKGSARPYMTVGSVMIGVASLGALTTWLGSPVGSFNFMTVGLMGVLFYGAARIPLSNWARTRERQMEDIITRLLSAVEETPATD